MPKSYSTKRTRDRSLFVHWDTRDDAVFTGLGLTRDTIKATQKQLIGTIVLPGDPSYDKDRMIANPIFNPSPAFTIYCEAESDVAIALTLSGQASKPFSVRSGGHCTAGFSSGAGVLIDVHNLDDVNIDKLAMTGDVGTGCDFAKFNKELEHWGLHTPGGECGGVCIGGYVQGGGIGFTSTTYGMNCDNVISMRVVLLSVKYRLYPMDKVFGWALAWRMSSDDEIANCVRLAQVLQEAYMTNLRYGKQLTIQLLLVYQSEIEPGVPLAGNVPVFIVRGLWDGDEATGKETMCPLLELTGCIPQFIVYDKYTEVLEQLLDKPQEQPVFPAELGDPFEDKASRYVSRDLRGDEWTSILKLFRDDAPNDYTYMYLEIYGGQMRNWTPEDNAFVHRDVHFDTVIDVYWFLNKDRGINDAFLQKWINLMETLWAGVYQNYCSANVPDYKWNYWKEALPGLVGAKNKYDPNRKFQFAQMVPYEVPAGYPAPEVPLKIATSLAQPIDYSGGISRASCEI